MIRSLVTLLIRWVIEDVYHCMWSDEVKSTIPPKACFAHWLTFSQRKNLTTSTLAATFIPMTSRAWKPLSRLFKSWVLQDNLSSLVHSLLFDIQESVKTYTKCIFSLSCIRLYYHKKRASKACPNYQTNVLWNHNFIPTRRKTLLDISNIFFFMLFDKLLSINVESFEVRRSDKFSS